VPLHLTLFAGRRELPQSEVSLILFLVILYPGSLRQPFDIQLCQFSIIFYLTCVHIDSIIWNDVSVSFFFQGLNQCNLLLDMISGSWEDIKWIDIQHFQEFFECFFIFLGYFPGRDAFTFRSLFQFIFSLIGIRGKMTYIGDVHDVFQRIAHDIFQCIPQEISEKIRSHITYMRIPIDGRSA
jgi:hypothetical protein